MMKHNKFGAKKSLVDGHVFDSIGESRRYGELKLRWLAKEIFDLELQPVYAIEANGKKICKVKGDFRYLENGRTVVEDFKGFQTPISRLKEKLVRAHYPDLDWRIVK